MAKRKRSSARPQPKHKKQKKSQHDKRKRLERRNLERKRTTKAKVPLAELLSYAPTLRSITGGRGDFHMEFANYAEVPKQLQEKIAAEAAKEDEDDE